MRIPVWLSQQRDLVVALLLAAAYAAEISSYPDTEPVALLLGVGAASATALRRRSPFATFVLVSLLNAGVPHWAPGFDGSSAVFVLVFLYNLYSLGAHARGVEAWLGVVGVLATVVSFVIGDGAHDPGDIFFAIAFVGTPWGAGVAVRLRGDKERELRARNEALQQEAAHAVAEERARIARELHDVVSHAIAVTVLQARGGKKMVGRDDEAVLGTLTAIERTNTSALADMRRLLSLLREADGVDGRSEPAPSLERLGELVEQVRASGLPVELSITGDAIPIPPGLDLSAYRIVQESLTNVLKHGGPRAQARVEVEYCADELELSVTNTGTTEADPDSTTGHGLLGIRERVAVAGGIIDAGPVEGGYAVHARLPYLTGAG
jgi:signal transduction histidine kinase